MNISPPHSPRLLSWASTAFEKSGHPTAYSDVFLRLFIHTADSVSRDLQFRIEEQPAYLTEKDCPEEGTWGEFVETHSEDKFAKYLSALEQNFSPGFSESFAFKYDDYDDDDSTSTAIFISLGAGTSPHRETAAFTEAYAVCQKRGKSEEFSDWCAHFIAEEGDVPFNLAFQKAEERFHKIEKLRSQGYSEGKIVSFLEATEGAEQMNETYAAVYADSVEQQLGYGRVDRSARQFAEIYTEFYDRFGSWEEAEDEREYENRLVVAMSEAAFRQPKNSAFSLTFESIALGNYPGGASYLQDYDKIEQSALDCLSKNASPKDYWDPNYEDDDHYQMSPQEIAKEREKAEEKAEAEWEKKQAYLEFCKQNQLDPEDEESEGIYKEVMAETDDAAWEAMSPEDRAGSEDNMHKLG
jgi:hypothetical protein